eukprot:7376368-Prymnesium_polylepis.2
MSIRAMISTAMSTSKCSVDWSYRKPIVTGIETAVYTCKRGGRRHSHHRRTTVAPRPYDCRRTGAAMGGCTDVR